MRKVGVDSDASHLVAGYAIDSWLRVPMTGDRVGSDRGRPGLRELRSMSRTILVVGNCHIGGISAALQWIFPADQVSAIPYNPHVLKGGSDAWAARTASADIVMGGDFVEVFLKGKGVVPRQFVKIPSLYFSAFHPDTVAAKLKSSGVRIRRPYHSAICLWAYSNRIEPADAVRLFSRKVFMPLGYFGRWEQSVARMKTAFGGCGLDFDRFYCAIKRDGIFMYTVNHPKVSLAIWLAKLLAIRIGHDQSVWRREILVSDALARVEIWPVYPEVAHELAVPGSYTWFVERAKVIEGLREYVEFAYANYSASGIKPDDVAVLGIDQALYQSVLSAELRRS
jgi:hypothetical protein